MKQKQTNDFEDLRDFLTRVNGKDGISIFGTVPLAEALYEAGYRKHVELKPCPFCGGNSIAVELDSVYGDDVWCENCGAKIHTDATEFPSAITLWNKMADNEQIH